MFDNSNCYQNGIYTVKKTGYYYVSSSVHNTNGQSAIQVQVNGIVRSRAGSDTGKGGPADYYSQISSVLKLVAGQKVKIVTEQIMAADGRAHWSGYVTWFNVAFLYSD